MNITYTYLADLNALAAVVEGPAKGVWLRVRLHLAWDVDLFVPGRPVVDRLLTCAQRFVWGGERESTLVIQVLIMREIIS